MNLDKDPDFQTREGMYLKAADMAGKSVKVTVHHADKDVFNKPDGTDESKLVLYFKGKEKGLVLNWTNLKTLKAAWGPETDGWAGRKLILSTKEYSFDGRAVTGFVCTPDAEELEDEIPF